MTSRAEFINQQLLLIDGQYAATGLPKHRKMTTSPFVFFRGTSQLFYADLAAGNILLPGDFRSVPLTNIMGDCHTSNFGFFTEEGSHNESVVFSINDFDDACIGHAVWDVLRFMVSLGLAADHCIGLQLGKYCALEEKHIHKPVVSLNQVVSAMESFLAGYIEILRLCCSSGLERAQCLSKTYNDFTRPSVLEKRYKKALSIAIGGELFAEKSALAKAVDLQQRPLAFRQHTDKFTRKGVNLESIAKNLAPYFYDVIHDAVFRLNSGTGSVNMQRFYLLIGPENVSASIADLHRCHVVEVKQQRTAAPIFYFPTLHHKNRLNPAHLTVKCQRSMQHRHDTILDEAYYDDAHWLIRSRHHAKVGIDPEHICFGDKNANQCGFENYAYACATELARAHCRGDMGSVLFEKSMLEAIKKNSDQLMSTANEYQNQVLDDWNWLRTQEN